MKRLKERIRTQDSQHIGCHPGGGNQGKVLGQPQPLKGKSTYRASRNNIGQEVVKGASSGDDGTKQSPTGVHAFRNLLDIADRAA